MDQPTFADLIISVILMFIFLIRVADVNADGTTVASIPNKYCNISENHAMCVFNTPYISMRCPVYVYTPEIEEEVTKAICNILNYWRGRFAKGEYLRKTTYGGVARMMELRWSKELEEIATRRVRQCLYREPADKYVSDLENTTVATNTFFRMNFSREKPVHTAAYLWYKAGSSINASFFNNPIYKEGMNRNFVNLVSNADYVGCGFLSTRSGANSSRIQQGYVICHFAPNVVEVGKPFFVPGNFCTQCPPETYCSKYGLCSFTPPEMDDTVDIPVNEDDDSDPFLDYDAFSNFHYVVEYNDNAVKLQTTHTSNETTFGRLTEPDDDYVYTVGQHISRFDVDEKYYSNSSVKMSLYSILLFTLPSAMLFIILTLF